MTGKMYAYKMMKLESQEVLHLDAHMFEKS